MSNKNIWVFRQYSDPPDGHWTNHYDLFREFIKKGYRVTIFSSSFSHFSRKDERLEKDEIVKEKYYGGIRFLFIKTTPYYNNNWRRFANFFSYSWRALRIGINDSEKPDIIIGCTPHPLGAYVGWYISVKRGARYFFEVHDLWPQFFVELGAYRNWHPMVIGLRWLEKFLANKSEYILHLWTNMNTYFKEQGIEESKCIWMPMGLNCENMIENPINSIKDDSKFNVMYRGRFGRTQDMDTILKAAGILQNDKKSNVCFIIVGEGPELIELKEKVFEMKLRNIVFRKFKPKEEMLNDMGTADLLLGSLPNLPHFKKYGMISTKLIDYLSSNRPIIFCASVEDHLIIRSKAGFLVPSQDSVSLSNTIKKVEKMNTDQRKIMGENGLNYLKNNHDVRILANRLEKLFNKF